MKLGVFRAFDNYHKYYVLACKDLDIDFDVIDILSSRWLENLSQDKYDGFLCRPPSKFQERKTMFDEKLYIVDKILKYPIYPSFEELYLYENKRMISYWLKLYKFPHPETHIFYEKKEYLDFIENSAVFPIVVKSNIGSASKGVSIIEKKREARRLANKYFGLINPKLVKGHTSIKTGKFFPVTSYGSREKHFIIIQKFENIKWEWRITKIGNSFFGHKKLKKGYFASGTGLKAWDSPDKELLDLVKNICEKNRFLSMTADILETVDGRYLVNELIPFVGQKTKHQMMINNVPGRYILEGDDYTFEEGEFNQNQSYNLRVEHFISLLKSGYYNKKN